MGDVTVYNLKTTGVPHGDLVDKADYDALQQRCERLEAAVRDMLEWTEYLPIHIIKNFETILADDPTASEGEKDAHG